MRTALVETELAAARDLEMEPAPRLAPSMVEKRIKEAMIRHPRSTFGRPTALDGAAKVSTSRMFGN